ncbi:GNAT family N-acetyltransferase [Parachitinimonas caeni]|uniref:GNAT family N-acetyltransferase n=1 Tax=Parachitinimonas caeni TaxID=3031301 RepID=A0ABT7DZU1_9NEIS|nr:GNAT family N-acetyltransferase [Parachitinimonas caeni]MDK2125584.1 GNAT family N-acetyltransferase [Parachitinimonas caeni]
MSQLPPPLYQTERLTLRHVVAADAAFICELMNEPDYLRNIGDRGVRTPDDARRYIADKFTASYHNNGFGLYCIERQADGVPVGICGLVKRPSLADIDLGYALLQRHWGQGYAREAAHATLHYARQQLGLQRLVAITDPANQPSIRLLEALGMRFIEQIVDPVDGEVSKFFSLELSPAH